MNSSGKSLVMQSHFSRIQIYIHLSKQEKQQNTKNVITIITTGVSCSDIL